MKQLFILLLAAVALAGCKETKKGGLDANSKLYINGLATQKATPAQGALTPLEIVQQAQGIFTDEWVMSIADWSRDFANVRFMLGGDYVVDKDGKLLTSMMSARNYFL